ncbi:hypothetical protein BH24DEI2_BH24DEI2_16790 [soil metagenome]
MRRLMLIGAMLMGVVGSALLLSACGRSAEQVLENELKYTRNELIQSRETLNELETNLAESRAEAETFRQQADILQPATAALPDIEGVEALRLRVSELENQAGNVTDNQRGLDEALANARTEIASLRDNINSLGDARADLERQLAEAQAAAIQAKVRAENADDVAETQEAALDVTRSSVTAETDALRAQLIALSEERDAALERVGEQTSLLSDMRTQLNDLRGNQAALEAQLQALSVENAAVAPNQEQIAFLQGQIDALQTNLITTREALRERPTATQLKVASDVITRLQTDLETRPSQVQLDALQSRLDVFTESPGATGAADLEARLLSACTQLGEAFTDPASLTYCDGYLTPAQSR